MYSCVCVCSGKQKKRRRVEPFLHTAHQTHHLDRKLRINLNLIEFNPKCNQFDEIFHFAHAGALGKQAEIFFINFWQTFISLSNLIFNFKVSKRKFPKISFISMAADD